MHSRDIEYFSAILQTGNVTKAAEFLHISQPSLSQYLMRFEGRLGAPVFDRSKTPWKLTDVGKCYANYINEFNQLSGRLDHDIQSIMHGKIEKQTITIGIPPWKGALVLPYIISRYSDQHPNVTIHVIESSSLELIRQVQEGEVTFAIMNTPFYNRHVIYEKLMDERIFLAAAKDHPLVKDRVTSAKRPAYFDISAIYDQRFIIPGPNQTITQEVNNLFARYKIKPVRKLYLNNILTCMNLASMGYGFTFIPQMGIELCRDHDRLAFFTPDQPELTWSLSIAYHTSQTLNLAVTELIELVKEFFREMVRALR